MTTTYTVIDGLQAVPGVDIMEKEKTIRVLAAKYEDCDDCLAAAAADYATAHGLTGWDLRPRWEDDQRDHIILTVPAWSE